MAARGKVRDIYDLGEKLLIVATDRLSAFDYILPTPIPDKGRVLTQMSAFWFEQFSQDVRHHLIEVVGDTPPVGFEAVADPLRGRSMICRTAGPSAPTKVMGEMGRTYGPTV